MTDHEEESLEWWEMPNIKAATNDRQEIQGEQTEGKGHHLPQEEKTVQSERVHGQLAKERWDVELGPWSSKTASLSPRDRNIKQHAARKRDKEESHHPYQFRDRRGRVSQEKGDLSD